MISKNWEIKKIAIKDLKLWDENPRFPDEYFNKKDKDLIDYYLKDEKRFELRKFAKEVVAEFDLPQVESIIILKLKNKYIVLEGNRRIATYKLLIHPSLAKDKLDVELFEELKKKIRIDNNFKLDANITTNKENGLRLMDRKHKKRNNEIGWGELERRNDSVRRLRGSAQDIRRVELGKFIRILDLPKEVIYKVLGKGYITTLYRIIDSDPARDRMRYDVTRNGKILIKNEKKFKKLLKIVVYNVYTKRRFGSKENDVDSRHLNTTDEIKDYFYSLFEKDVVKVEKAIREGQEKKQKTKKIRAGKKEGPKLSPTCFVIMPLSGLDSVYKRVQIAWKQVFGKNAQIYHQKDDQNKGSRELIDIKISKNIQNAQAVVSIISMGDKEKQLYQSMPAKKRASVFRGTFPFNINVALETGYAMHCVDDDRVSLYDYFLIADKSGKINAYNFAKNDIFDLSHRDITPYTETELDKLEATLIKSFKNFKKEYKL